jgi:hypothetical protein
VLDRLRRATGLEPTAALTSTLPPSFLGHPVPPPDELLATLSLGRRTVNVLRRRVATGADEGRWTYGRLLGVPGFGVAALLDVLEALEAQTPQQTPATMRTLGEELATLATTVGAPVPQTTPLLDRAIGIIGQRLPAGERELSVRLRGHELVEEAFDLGQLERAARFYARALPFAVLRREGLVVAVPAEQLSLARKSYDMASRSMVLWGLTTISNVCFRAGTEATEFVTRLLAAHRSFQWLDRRQGWFWLGNTRSSLLRTIEKILVVAGRVRLADLARTLFRRRPPPLIPPVRALAELCRHSPQLVVERQVVKLASQGRALHGLSDADNRVVELFRTLGRRIDFRDSTLALRPGFDFDGNLRRLRSSPLVLEPQPGVFQLIGS